MNKKPVTVTEHDRSGGIIAATWATLVNNGLEGYREMTRAVVETTLFLAKG